MRTLDESCKSFTMFPLRLRLRVCLFFVDCEIQLKTSLLFLELCQFCSVWFSPPPVFPFINIFLSKDSLSDSQTHHSSYMCSSWSSEGTIKEIQDCYNFITLVMIERYLMIDRSTYLLLENKNDFRDVVCTIKMISIYLILR